MNYHPGGKEHTLRMLELSALKPGSIILDMGAGGGETVEILCSMGYDARGIDIEPRGANVKHGDFLKAPFPDESFDGIISQCAFYVSGNVTKAFSEANRLLKNNGVLMLSDVWFQNATQTAENAGFCVLHSEDMTGLWREYYFEALWSGELRCNIRGKCTYELLICRKEKYNGYNGQNNGA